MRKVRRNDLVMVVRGRSKGHVGEVFSYSDGKVLVRGAQLVKRHRRASPQHPESEVVEQESPIDISNVMLIDPKTKTPVRVGFKMVDGKKVRFSKKTGEVIS
jgi:large subunit ribosomal protein L24